MPHQFNTPDEFIAAAEALITHATTKQPTAVLSGEVDGYAALAESRGPESAQAVLDGVFEMVRHALRDGDVIAQLDERILIVLVAASAENGRSVGERIAASVRVHAFAGADGPVTLSFGAAAAPDHGDTYEALAHAAEATMLRVQFQGGDGASAAPLAHHQPLHRPLAIDRFAGRVQDLAMLNKWLDEACGGDPRLVTVSADAGLGSATLLRQLESEVRLRGGRFVIAGSRNSPVRDPYAVWVEVLKQLERLPSRPRREWRELQNLVPTVGGGDRLEAQAHSQYLLFEEIAEYITMTAESAPLVLVLDEMQWADITSWDVLERLVAHLDSDRLMVCMTMRPGTLPAAVAQHREALSGYELARSVTLSGLTRAEVKQWLEGAFHRQQVGREFLAFLYRHTEGNPLFINHVLRSLLEDGAIWHSGERWEWSPVSELRLPAGLSALLAHRLSRFSSSTQAVLWTAAIIGRTFDVSLVVAAGAGSEPAVQLALSEGLAAGLLRPSYERYGGGYAFTHEQVREALVESIPRERLAPLHERVGQALEKRPTRVAREIAFHFDRAHSMAAAFRYGQLAANDAERVYANAAAVGYLELAARNATTPGELADVRVALAYLAEAGGRYDEVEELCDLAIEWFDTQGDRRRALTLRRMRERARMEQGQPARITLDSLKALDDEARTLGFDRERVTILTMASQTHGRLGDQRTAERIASECVEMAERIGDRPLLAESLNRHCVSMLQATPARAREIAIRALHLYEGAGDVRGQARCYINLGVATQLEGKIPEAIRAMTMAVSVCRAAGMPDLWGMAALNFGVLSQKSGDYDKAREQFGEAIELFASVKNSQMQLAALYNMAHVERELGAWDSAIDLYEATLPLAQRVGQSDIEIGSIAGIGICFLELGRVEDARERLAEVEERLVARPDWFQGRELIEALAVRLAVLDGRVDEARARIDTALTLAEPTEVYAAAWLTAVCADAIGDIDPGWLRSSISRYAEEVGKLGYAEMARRYEILAKR